MEHSAHPRPFPASQHPELAELHRRLVAATAAGDAAETDRLYRSLADRAAWLAGAVPVQPAQLGHEGRADRRLERVDNAKIHEGDIPRQLPKVDATAFLARARARIRDHRKPGDPASRTLRTVAQCLSWGWRTQRSGAARLTHRALATAADCCPETLRRCIRWLEAADLVDTINVMERMTVDGVRRIVRGANLYLAVPQKPDTAEAPEFLPASGLGAVAAAIGRAERAIGRWSRQLGLVASIPGFRRPSPSSG